jgi:hypothetical protein
MKYQDDVVMAFAFSYICRMCYNGLVPIQMEELQKQLNEPRPRRFAVTRKRRSNTMSWHERHQ